VIKVFISITVMLITRIISFSSIIWRAPLRTKCEELCESVTYSVLQVAVISRAEYANVLEAHGSQIW